MVEVKKKINKKKTTRTGTNSDHTGNKSFQIKKESAKSIHLVERYGVTSIKKDNRIEKLLFFTA